jgi:hypothetical protein
MTDGNSGSPEKYPKAEVEQVLQSWWTKQMASPLRRSPKAPAVTRKEGGTIWDVQPELSSQQAVTVIADLEQILGFRPKTSVIRHGGYRGIDQFVRHLSANVESAFNERYGTAQSSAPAKTAEKEVTLNAQL